MEEPGDFKPVVGIVGGRGRMGQWFARLLTGRGYLVRIIDRGAEPLGEAVVRACGIVLLAVPVKAMAEVMRTIGPWTGPDQLVVDICSLKAEPCRLMAVHARGPVIGTHPLFGPGVASPAGQTVFVCDVSGGPWLMRVNDFWQGLGAVVVPIDPARHDRLMAAVQTLRHLVLASLGATLADLGLDRRTLAPLAGPWFGELLALLDRQNLQPPDLYADLALANPHSAEAVETLARHLARAGRHLNHHDRDGLIALLAPDDIRGRQVGAARAAMIHRHGAGPFSA